MVLFTDTHTQYSSSPTLPPLALLRCTDQPHVWAHLTFGHFFSGRLSQAEKLTKGTHTSRMLCSALRKVCQYHFCRKVEENIKLAFYSAGSLRKHVPYCYQNGAQSSTPFY